MAFKMKMKTYGQGKSPIKFFGAQSVLGMFGKKRRNRGRNAANRAMAGVPNPQNPNPQNLNPQNLNPQNPANVMPR